MVERYHPTSDSISLIAPHSRGDYVRYSDYAALEAQLAERVRVAPMVTEWREITEDDQPPRDVPVLMGRWESWPRDEWVVEFGLYGSTKGGWIHGRMTHWLPASILPIAPALTAEQEPASMVTEAKVDAALAAFEYAGRYAYTRARIKAALKAAMEAGR